MKTLKKLSATTFKTKTNGEFVFQNYLEFGAISGEITEENTEDSGTSENEAQNVSEKVIKALHRDFVQTNSEANHQIEKDEIEIRKVEKVFFEKREEMVLPSYSKQDPGMIRGLRNEGWKIYSPGNGWVYASLPSRVVLRFLGEKTQIDVAPFFRENSWEKLTEKRIKAIIETAPEEVFIEGDTVSKTCLESWFERAKKFHKSMKSLHKRKDANKNLNFRSQNRTPYQAASDIAVRKKVSKSNLSGGGIQDEKVKQEAPNEIQKKSAEILAWANKDDNLGSVGIIVSWAEEGIATAAIRGIKKKNKKGESIFTITAIEGNVPDKFQVGRSWLAREYSLPRILQKKVLDSEE